MRRRSSSLTSRLASADVRLWRKAWKLRAHQGDATLKQLAAGVSDAIARAIIGHESAAVFRVYTHLDLATMRQAMQKMPAVGTVKESLTVQLLRKA